MKKLALIVILMMAVPVLGQNENGSANGNGSTSTSVNGKSSADGSKAAPAATAEASRKVAPPSLPYYDWTACPGEGCVYGEWTARKAVVVYDTWKDKRKAVARIAKGDTVAGVNGVVITVEPGVIRLDRDVAGGEAVLKRGDTLLTYTYRGEGYSAVWFNGSYYPYFDTTFTKWPHRQGCGGASCAATYVKLGKKAWRAEVQLKSGQMGWVDMDMDGAEFDGVGSSAGPKAQNAGMAKGY